MSEDITGYDPKAELPEGREHFEYRLVMESGLFSMRRPGLILRNGTSIGLVYLDSQEEFDWLEKRIQGTFKPEPKPDE